MQWDQAWAAVWKSVVVLMLLILMSRITGRKLLSQMSYFDFVGGITIGTLGATYITQMVTGHWILLAPVVLTIFTIAWEVGFIRSLKLRKVVQGEPVVVIQNGQVLDKNMKKLRYSLNQLEMQLRTQGVFDFGWRVVR